LTPPCFGPALVIGVHKTGTQSERNRDVLAGGFTVTEPTSQQPQIASRERGNAADEALNQIRDSLHGLRFGSVNIIVQDGVIIQIDRTEKRRLRTNRGNAS
jgi:hypothetical protein